MGIYCKMTGDFNIQVDGKRIDFFSKSSYKATQLLAMLLYYHDEGVSKASLIENLYGEDSNADPVNSLKALMFRLRRQLEETDIESERYVVFKDGLYRFDPEVEFDSDVLRFQRYIKQAENVTDEAEALEIYTNAINAINGSLLPMFAAEMWVIVEKAALEEKFSNLVRKLTIHYKQQNDFTMAKSLYFRAKAMFPYEDEWELGYLNCLVKEGRLEEASEEYERYKKVLFDDMAMYPSDMLQQCYRMIVKKKNFDDLNANDVIAELIAAKPTSAYRCSFPQFADNYHLLKRIMQRSGIESSLVLCGIVDKQNRLVTEYDLINKQVTYLENALLNGLRKSDVITRYGVSQMLILLWNTPKENVEVVIRRISESFNMQNRDNKYHIKYLVLDNDKLNEELKG